MVDIKSELVKLISRHNEVDMSVAWDMLRSSITNNANYLNSALQKELGIEPKEKSEEKAIIFTKKKK